jgi:AmiR/NasT family two-component response regulator
MLVQMTRPGFLVITAVACFLGTAIAAACGHRPNVWTAVATLVLADQPERLTSAIVLTIAAAVVHGLAMSAGLLTLIF